MSEMTIWSICRTCAAVHAPGWDCPRCAAAADVTTGSAAALAASGAAPAPVPAGAPLPLPRPGRAAPDAALRPPAVLRISTLVVGAYVALVLALVVAALTRV